VKTVAVNQVEWLIFEQQRHLLFSPLAPLVVFKIVRVETEALFDGVCRW